MKKKKNKKVTSDRRKLLNVLTSMLDDEKLDIDPTKLEKSLRKVTTRTWTPSSKDYIIDFEVELALKSKNWFSTDALNRMKTNCEELIKHHHGSLKRVLFNDMSYLLRITIEVPVRFSPLVVITYLKKNLSQKARKDPVLHQFIVKEVITSKGYSIRYPTLKMPSGFKNV